MLALPFSPTSSGRHYAGFPVATKTPGICINFAFIDELVLFGIISELISRITWSLPLVYSVYFRKIYRFIYAKFPDGNTIVGKRRIQDFRAQGPVVRRPIRANTGLNFILGFFTPLFESLFGIIFSILYEASNHQIVDKKNYTEFSMKPFRSEIRFHTNSGLS